MLLLNAVARGLAGGTRLVTGKIVPAQPTIGA